MNSREENRTYYDILHVQANAPAPIIKNAYRALMLSMKQHPDLGGDTQQAALINEAYETLIDAEKRAAYDQMLTTKKQENIQTEDSQDNFQQSSSSQFHSNAAANAYQQSGARCSFCYRFHNTPPGELLDCGGCGSPLDPPPVGLNTENAARSIDRIPKNTDIQLTETVQSRPKIANLRDLSPQGLGFVTDADLSPRQIVKVGCPLFEGLAAVAHKRPLETGGAFYGAQFLTLRFQSTSGNFISTHL